MIGWLLRITATVGLPSWVLPAVMAGFFMSALGGAYVKGRVDASANCKEAELHQQIATLQADLAAQKLAAEFETNARRYLEEQNRKNEQELMTYETELQNRSSASCNLDAADIKRLRRIGATNN
mgnify:CR=1 FL=1